MQEDRPHPGRIETFFSKTALWFIMAAGLLLLILIFKIGKTATDVQVTSAYTRVSNCILAKNAIGRTQAEIEDCYKQVEQDTGITLKRFDKQPVEKTKE